MADFTTGPGADGGLILTFSGPLIVSSVASVDGRLRALSETAPDAVTTIDLGNIGRIDTVGAWTAWSLSRRLGAPIVNASTEAERLIAAISRSDHNVDPIDPPDIAEIDRGYRVWRGFAQCAQSAIDVGHRRHNERAAERQG